MIISMLRKGLHSWWFKGFMWGVAAIYILSSLAPAFLTQMGQSSSWVMTVNAISISSEQFMQRVQQEQKRVAYLRQQLGAFAKNLGIDLNPNNLATEGLIQEALLDSVADALNIRVEPELVKIELMRLLRSTAAQGEKLDLNQLLQRVCSASGLSPEQIERDIYNSLRRMTVLDCVEGSLYVPSFSITNAIIQRYADKKFAVLELPFAGFLKEAQKHKATNEEVVAFFEHENKENKRYWQNARRRGQVWRFTPETYGITVDDQAVESYYTKNKHTEFRIAPAQIKIETIAFTHEKNAQEAAQNSALFAQNADKKVVDYFSRGTHDTALEDAVFALKEDGAITPVIKVSDTFVIAKRLGRKAATYKPLEEVQEAIRKALVVKKFKRTFTAEARRAINALEKNPKAIEEFVGSKHGVHSSPEPVEQDGSALSKALFGLKKSGMYTGILDGDAGMIVGLMEIQPAAQLVLEDIRARVENDYAIKQAHKAINKALKEALSLSVHSSLNSVAEKVGGRVIMTPYINHEKTDEIATLQKNEKIPVQELWQLELQGATVSLPSEGESNGYIIRLDDIKAMSAQDEAQRKATVKQALIQERKQALEQGFVASLRRAAIIKKNDEFLSRLNEHA